MSKDTGKRRSRRHRGKAREARFEARWEEFINTCTKFSNRMDSMARNFRLMYGGRNQLPVVFPKPRVQDPTQPTLDPNTPIYCFIGPYNPDNTLGLLKKMTPQ